MPVYLGFFAGSQKKFAVSPARSKLAHFTWSLQIATGGTRHRFILYQNWVPANLLKKNCSRIFIYQADKIVGCWIKFGHRTGNFKFLMASFDEFTSWVRLLLNLVGKYGKMYSEKLKFSTLLKHP
jgi:hypothetical protein